MRIEKLEKKYVPYVAQLEESCFSDSWSPAGIEAELQNKTSRCFVVLDAEDVVGYLNASFVVDEASINRIAVAAPYRRSGVGTLLMRALLHHALEEDMAFVTLEVRRNNQAAIRFYETFGFVQTGLRQNFYLHPKEDAVLMTVERRKLIENFRD